MKWVFCVRFESEFLILQGEWTMVYKWLFELSDIFSAFNVFRYITFRSFLSFFTAFFVCWILGPYFIKSMKKSFLSEKINTNAPSTHLKKKGTPTMGGVLILICLLVSVFFWTDFLQPLVYAVLFVTLSFALIGFWDDWLKVRYNKPKGLSARLRLLLEFLISSVVLFVLCYFQVIDTVLYLPFFKNLSFDLSWGYVFFGSFIIVGFSNAVNLTDGLDGLAIFPVMICSLALGLFSYLAGHFELSAYLGIPFISGAGELVPLAMALSAASLGFLWYNSYPAQIFMGDVGSLSVGGFLGTVAVLTKNELLIPLLGGIFIVEAVSVISQVFSFQLTGRRIFSMAPLHHHFELKGVSESKIIVRFWIISILLAVLSFATLKLR